MDKEKNVKKAGKSGNKVKLEDLISRLPESVIVRETRRGHILRHDKLYLMHVKQSPKGILHFLRTKTGKHLESNYATREKEINSLIQEINDKIKDQKIDDKIKSGGETKSTSPPSKGKK